LVLQNIFNTFVEKFSIMKLHKLTDAEILALNKLKASSFSYFKRHLPIKSSNIYIAKTSKALNRLSQAIAVDVYTSGIGKERLRSCYDCLRELNKHGKLGDVEPYLRQLNEKVQYYLGILCGTIKPAETHNINPPVSSKKTKAAKQKKQQANAVKAQQRAKAMFESRLHAYTPDSQIQSQYRSVLTSHNLTKDDDYEYGLSDID
jgi:hypothetical protein